MKCYEINDLFIIFECLRIDKYKYLENIIVGLSKLRYPGNPLVVLVKNAETLKKMQCLYW